MCESLYMYGVMLLLIDLKVPGAVREKIIIAYYRHEGQCTISNIHQITRLFKSSGYIGKSPFIFGELADGVKWPASYPESYLNRSEVDLSLVEKMIMCLKDGDLYNQIEAYPN